MSYILDALKKLEQEKARKAKTAGSIFIAGELFNENRPANSRNNGRKAAFAVLLAVVITFGVTWYLLKGKGGANHTISNPPQIPLKNALPSSLPVIPPISSARSLSGASPVQSGANSDQNSTNQLASPMAEPKPSRRIVRKQSVALPPQTTKKNHDAIEVKELAPPADIQVNGVAWQDERGLRRAVVNGLLLKEGSTIVGAQLKEILPDRVRFERSGSLFEVPFVSSSKPVGNK